MNEPVTVKLAWRNGREVLAKLYEGQPSALTYSNRTQANRKAAEMGAGWSVYQFGRPFYVGKDVPDPEADREVERVLREAGVPENEIASLKAAPAPAPITPDPIAFLREALNYEAERFDGTEGDSA